MNMNVRKNNYFIILITLLTIELNAQAPIWPTVSNTWNKINCTFSEIHPTGTDHIHGAIDINMANNQEFKAISDGKIRQDASSNDFLIVEHDLQTLNDINSSLKRVKYGDVTDPLSGISDFLNVNQGKPLGFIVSGGHLHFEMWIRDGLNLPWRRVNPLDNPNANYTNLPPNEPDTWNPELNDVVLHGISEPIGINSGIIATGTGVINNFQGNHTRIHFLDHPGQTNANGAAYNSNTGRVIVFGSIGSILHERDPRVTNPPTAIGTGLGIHSATLNIDNQEKYFVKFDEILDTELTSTVDFYATPFDPPMAFGNNDYLKMRRITGETARRPHKLMY